MNFSFNKWHLYLATLVSPIGIILFLALSIGSHHTLFDRITNSFIVFSIISIISYLCIFYNMIQNQLDYSKAEIAYSILSFVCMLPLYFISGFFFVENLNIHL